MLVSLHVKNLALIDEEEICFEKGLNILTGETGAGKSIIIGSVNLALGAKADKELIRTGAEYALIELVFQLDEKQERKLREMEFYPEEDGSFIIQRKIMPARSVCKVCGETVGAKQLQDIAEILIAIHGQHENQTLLQKKRHRETLDEYAGKKAADCRKRVWEGYQEYVRLLKELEDGGTDVEAREREAALLRFEVEEIGEAGLTAGEDEELEKNYRRMVNSRKIKEAACAAYRMTGAGVGENAGETVGRALREIRSVSAYDEALEDLEAMLGDIDGLLNDFNRQMADYVESLEYDEAEFVQTENRLNLLNHLKSKYGKNMEEVLAYKQRGEEKLKVLEHYESYRQQTEQKLEETKRELEASCEKLSRLRTRQAAELGKRLSQALVELNFEDVQLEIRVQPRPGHFTADGYDDVEFLISTNKGEQLKPLSQVASGGELSRIMLAFKTVLADKDEISSLIFDEIDTGISGKTAWKVSEKLGILGKDHQVICITHLPQIAAMSDVHFLIEKSVKRERTVTNIRKIDGEEDLRELARMLGGAEITEAALENAREMKDLARNTKQY